MSDTHAYDSRARSFHHSSPSPASHASRTTHHSSLIMHHVPRITYHVSRITYFHVSRTSPRPRIYHGQAWLKPERQNSLVAEGILERKQREKRDKKQREREADKAERSGTATALPPPKLSAQTALDVKGVVTGSQTSAPSAAATLASAPVEAIDATARLMEAAMRAVTTTLSRGGGAKSERCQILERTHQLWALCDLHAHLPWAPSDLHAHQLWARCDPHAHQPWAPSDLHAHLPRPPHLSGKASAQDGISHH